MYRNGDVPIHLIADAERLPLAVTHLVESELNQSRKPEEWNPTYVRHGGRGPLVDGVAGTALVDMTALVTLHYLGLLMLMPKLFSKVILPVQASAMLHGMSERIETAQPERIRYLKQVLSAIRGRVIAVVPTQDPYTWATASAGFFVTSVPSVDFKTHEIVPLSETMSEVTVNLRRLIDSLVALGLLTSWQREDALRILGTEGAVAPAGPTITRPAKLLFDSAHVGLMQEAQLLQPLIIGNFELYISEPSRRFVQWQVDEAEKRDQAASKLAGLMDVIRDGVDRGLFHFRGTGRSSELGANADAISALLEEAQVGEKLFVDDRYCNRFERTEKGAAVLSSFDVTATLRSNGAIQDDEYYRVLHVGRRSGLLFIPVEVDEILHHLTNAPISDGHVQETARLIALRRYLGGALRQPGIHLVVTGPSDERIFLRMLDDAMRAAVEASSGKPEWLEYLMSDLRAAQLSAIRQGLDGGTSNEAWLGSVDQIVERYLR